MGNDVAFTLATASYADGVLTVTGNLVGWDGAPMPDDGMFALRTHASAADGVTLALEIDSDGTFTASGASPISWTTGDAVSARLVYGEVDVFGVDGYVLSNLMGIE